MFPRNLKPLKNKSFFLFGPRGTGKTTWLKTHYSSCPRLDFLRESTFQEFLRDPSRLESWIFGNPQFDQKNPIILDEVQRLPEILNEVHRLIESRGFKFILTGSSARKLKQNEANLLAGRAVIRKMHPLSSEELGPSFDLKKSLRFGQLPMAYQSDDPIDYLKSYVGVYLKEEIQQEAYIRNLGAFSRFLEAASFSQGAVLSVASLANDVGIDRKTAEGYLTLLEDLLLARRLPVFTRRAKRKMTTHPKFFFFDTGVFQILRPRGPLDLGTEIDGAALETLVLQDLRAIIDSEGESPSNTRPDLEIYFWRSQKQEEVDFILYGNSGFIALEIKRSNRIRDEDLHALREFSSDYPEARCFFLYGGEERLKIGKIHCIPLLECFKNWRAVLEI